MNRVVSIVLVLAVALTILAVMLNVIWEQQHACVRYEKEMTPVCVGAVGSIMCFDQPVNVCKEWK